MNVASLKTKKKKRAIHKKKKEKKIHNIFHKYLS